MSDDMLPVSMVRALADLRRGPLRRQAHGWAGDEGRGHSTRTLIAMGERGFIAPWEGRRDFDDAGEAHITDAGRSAYWRDARRRVFRSVTRVFTRRTTA